jgi:hypothetical protein
MDFAFILLLGPSSTSYIKNGERRFDKGVNAQVEGDSYIDIRIASHEDLRIKCFMEVFQALPELVW